MSAIRRSLYRLKSPLAEFGVMDGFVYLIDRFLTRFTSNSRLLLYEFLEQPISDRPLLPARLAKGIEVRQIGRDDPAVNLMPISDDTKSWRFDQGAVCLGAFSESQLIGYIWFATGYYAEDEIRCDYQLPSGDDAVFDFGLYLFPEHRLGLGFVGLWNGASQFLYSNGKRRSFSRLARFNVVSGRAHEHLGARRIGRALTLRLGIVELMYASFHPRLQASARRSKRMRLRLMGSQL